MRQRIRRLSFDVGPPGAVFPFPILKRVCGIEVGITAGILTGKARSRLFGLCETEGFFVDTVGSMVLSCETLGLALDGLHIQFAFCQNPFGGLSVNMARAVVGKRGRALVIIESDILANGQLALCTIDSDPNDASRIFSEDVIPHELMHIIDVRDGRSPSMYPWVFPGEGEWVDYFRHLWIDGYLEQRGLPHCVKTERVRELSEQVGENNAQRIASIWWGKPMTLRDAVSLGLSNGLTMKADCPLAVWYGNTLRGIETRGTPEVH